MDTKTFRLLWGTCRKILEYWICATLDPKGLLQYQIFSNYFNQFCLLCCATPLVWLLDHMSILNWKCLSDEIFQLSFYQTDFFTYHQTLVPPKFSSLWQLKLLKSTLPLWTFRIWSSKCNNWPHLIKNV